MRLEIKDDIDLEKISGSGQCFRARRFEDGTYRFISADKVIYMKEEKKGIFDLSCSESEWNDFWYVYFDMERNYENVAKKALRAGGFIEKAAQYGRGIRILRQDSWESLITFIISQRKNIPAIAKSVEMLSLRYGRRLDTEREVLYSFPTPNELSKVTEENLVECSLGYRAKYVMDAIQKINDNEINLSEISLLDDEDLLECLQAIKGVGKKVANCIALFAYQRTSCVPIDVWIKRAIDDDFKGVSPFDDFGKDAGIIQQYVFYYERNFVKNNG